MCAGLGCGLGWKLILSVTQRQHMGHVELCKRWPYTFIQWANNNNWEVLITRNPRLWWFRCSSDSRPSCTRASSPTARSSGSQCAFTQTREMNLQTDKLLGVRACSDSNYLCPNSAEWKRKWTWLGNRLSLHPNYAMGQPTQPSIPAGNYMDYGNKNHWMAGYGYIWLEAQVSELGLACVLGWMPVLYNRHICGLHR